MEMLRKRGILMNIAVCDDQPVFLKDMGELLRAYFQVHGIPCELFFFLSGEALLESGQVFDLIFLDIKMKGMTGIEAAHAIRGKDQEARLIFLTAYSKYVFQAFDVNAFHYLLKPVETEKLYSVLDQLINQLDSGRDKYLNIKKASKAYRIPFQNIYYLEVVDRKVFLHTTNETIEFYEKLSILEERLPPDFFRCHRSYIVNLNHVFRFDKYNIYLDNQEAVMLSKRRYGEFTKAFFNNMRKEGDVL